MVAIVIIVIIRQANLMQKAVIMNIELESLVNIIEFIQANIGIIKLTIIYFVAIMIVEDNSIQSIMRAKENCSFLKEYIV